MRNGTHERHMMAFEANFDRRLSRPARSSSSVVRLSLPMRSQRQVPDAPEPREWDVQTVSCGSAVDFSVNLGCNHVKKIYNFCERDKLYIVAYYDTKNLQNLLQNRC